MQRPNGYDFMRQQGASVRQGPANYAGSARPQVGDPRVRQVAPPQYPLPPVQARPGGGVGEVGGNRSWRQADPGAGNAYAAPQPPAPRTTYNAVPPAYAPMSHGSSAAGPSLPLPPAGQRPGAGGFIPFVPAPPQTHGPSYVPGTSTAPGMKVAPSPGFGGGMAMPSATPGVQTLAPQGGSSLNVYRPDGPLQRATPGDSRPMGFSRETRTVLDDVSDQLGLSGQGASSGAEVNTSTTGTSAAEEQRGTQNQNAPPTEGAPTPIGAAFNAIFPAISASVPGILNPPAPGDGPLGKAAGAIANMLGDPVIGAANAMNEGEKSAVMGYYDQFKDLNPSKWFGESMLDPGVQAAQEQAAREGMRSEIDRQRDAALRMGAAQAARGGRQSSGWDQGIYGEALRNTQQGERDLIMDAFKRRLSAGQLGSSVLSDRANTIYGAMQPGYTSPKELAAMALTAFPDLMDALIPG